MTAQRSQACIIRHRVIDLPRLLTLIAVGVLLFTPPQAKAADNQAAVLVKIFTDVCVPNMGNPDGVRAWAAENRLSSISATAPLQVFVGAGDKGAAWAIPNPYGNFALSIRGLTQACAVWAQSADPVEVETDFKQIIEGVKRPGLDIRVDKDLTKETPNGKVHVLVYNIIAPGNPTDYEFTMMTAERASGPFQASIQVAKARAD